MTIASCIVITAIFVCLAICVAKARPMSPMHLWFGILMLLVATWIVGVTGFYHGQGKDVFLSISFASACLIPVAFFNFTSSYPTPPGDAVRRAGNVIFLIGCVLAILCSTRLIVYALPEAQFGVYRKAGPLYPVFASYFLLTWTLAIGILIRKWKQSSGTHRVQLQYLGVGLIVSGTTCIFTNLLLPLVTGRSTYGWLAPYLLLPFALLVAHAIIRHRLMDVRVVIHRGLTIVIATALSLAPLALVGWVLWPRLSTRFLADELPMLLLAAVVVALLVPITRDIATRLLDRYVYRRRANYQRTVRNASGALTRMLDLSVLLPFIDRTVADSTACEGAATYLVRADRLVRVHAEVRDEHGRFRTPATAPARLAAVLGTTREPLVTEELERDATTEADRALHRDLAGLGWALLLPLVSEDALIGILAVGAKRSGDPFYPDDLDLLMTLANQAGVAVHNAQLYAQVVLANEYIENIVATIESGVVAVDAEGRVTMFNRAAEELTGIKASAAPDVDSLPECLASALRRAVQERERRIEPEVALPAGETTRPVMCTTAPLRDLSGAVLGAVAVFSDLTALKELETQRRRAERLAYFEVLASGIAHEIKNPLVAIKTFVQLVPRRHLDRDFVDNFSLIVAREIGAMERLVDRLRTLSRPGERPHRIIDLRTPVAEALDFLAPRFEEHAVTLHAELGAEPAHVLGEEGELKELFLNLLMNATDVAPPRSTIAIRLATAEARASVAILDSGPGVPPELMERIFDPFFTTKEHGSGLGLSICAGIAEAHDARMTAANRPDGGAVFTVDFPLAAAVAAEVKQ